jgi:hypothetical protein
MKPHDKDNKLRKLYYERDSGFADTEIRNQHYMYKKSKTMGGRSSDSDEEDPLAQGNYAKRWDDGSMYKTKEWSDLVEKLSSGGHGERDAYLSSMLEREHQYEEEGQY